MVTGPHEENTHGSACNLALDGLIKGSFVDFMAVGVYVHERGLEKKVRDGLLGGWWFCCIGKQNGEVIAFVHYGRLSSQVKLTGADARVVPDEIRGIFHEVEST